MAGYAAAIFFFIRAVTCEGAGPNFYFSCFGSCAPAMYLMHSAASSAVWPLDFNQSIKRDISFVVNSSFILSTSCQVIC